MANKRTKQKKTKQSTSKGMKGGSSSFDNLGSPTPVKKQKKKK